jgi:glycosyltransferase involved in cell wall biosynthesis
MPNSEKPKNNKLTFTLLMPTVNEEAGLRQMMPRIQKNWVDEIVVVDGGSTDRTCEVARDAGCRVIKQVKPGLAECYVEALEQISNDVVITFSPDGNSIPEIIPNLIEKMKEDYDLVIVSRYLKGAGSDDDDAVTNAGNKLFTNMINILFGSHYTDTLVMFRAWRTRLVKPELPIVPTRAGYDVFTSLICAKNKLKVAEIPGKEPKRIGSERKMIPLLNGWDVLRTIVAYRTFGTRAFPSTHA